MGFTVIVSLPRWEWIRLEQLPRDDQMSNFLLDGHHSNDLCTRHRWQAVAHFNNKDKTFFGYNFPYKLKRTNLVYYDKNFSASLENVTDIRTSEELFMDKNSHIAISGALKMRLLNNWKMHT